MVDLIGELEMENNDTKLNNESVMNSSRNDIQINGGGTPTGQKKSNCKC